MKKKSIVTLRKRREEKTLCSALPRKCTKGTEIRRSEPRMKPHTHTHKHSLSQMKMKIKTKNFGHRKLHNFTNRFDFL